MGIQAIFSVKKANDIIIKERDDYIVIGDNKRLKLTIPVVEGKAVADVNYWGTQRGLLLPLLEKNNIPYKEV